MKGNDLILKYGHNEFITIKNQKNEALKVEHNRLDERVDYS